MSKTHRRYTERHDYDVGDLKQDRNGYVHKKLKGGKWLHEARWVAQNVIVRRDLNEGEKVYRKHPDRENNHPSNLVVIQFATTKYKLLPHTRPYSRTPRILKEMMKPIVALLLLGSLYRPAHADILVPYVDPQTGTVVMGSPSNNSYGNPMAGETYVQQPSIPIPEPVLPVPIPNMGTGASLFDSNTGVVTPVLPLPSIGPTYNK